MALANMTQQETNEHNRDYCKHIAHTVEDYAFGKMYRCDECGEVISARRDFEEFEGYGTCPHCGATVDPNGQLSLYDWLEDALDIEYSMSSSGAMLGARVMVTCGGPNVYVDTRDCEVKLYWWTDRASWLLNRDACDELDAYLHEFFEMAKTA